MRKVDDIAKLVGEDTTQLVCYVSTDAEEAKMIIGIEGLRWKAYYQSITAREAKSIEKAVAFEKMVRYDSYELGKRMVRYDDYEPELGKRRVSFTPMSKIIIHETGESLLVAINRTIDALAGAEQNLAVVNGDGSRVYAHFSKEYVSPIFL